MDLSANIDRIGLGKFKAQALAFAGYKDNNDVQLIKDDKKLNHVDIFFCDGICTHNDSNLKTLIGTCHLDNINKNLIDKLGDKDFSNKLRKSSIERNFEYNYYLSYFIQALIQIILIDNAKILTSIDCAFIKLHWDNFLKELMNPGFQSVSDGYKPDVIEKRECPYKFVNFMLNKLLGKDLFEKLEIDD